MGSTLLEITECGARLKEFVASLKQEGVPFQDVAKEAADQIGVPLRERGQTSSMLGSVLPPQLAVSRVGARQPVQSEVGGGADQLPGPATGKQLSPRSPSV